jgi:hypothetical protein
MAERGPRSNVRWPLVEHLTSSFEVEDTDNASRPTLNWDRFGRLLFDLLSFGRGSVSLFGRLGFSHVFAFLRRAVKARAFPVVHMRFRINPHQTVTPAGRRWVSCCVGACARCGGTARNRTGCCGTLRLEQIAEVKLSRRW